MQFLGVFKAFEGETFCGKAAKGNEAGTLLKMALEASPLFFVEFFGGVKGVAGELLLFRFQRGKKAEAKRVGFV